MVNHWPLAVADLRHWYDQFQIRYHENSKTIKQKNNG